MSARHLSRFVSVPACAACLLGVVFVVGARAQSADDSFKEGLDARDAKKWQEAVDHMRRAIAAQPRESTRKVRTGIFGSTEYLPYYFLGEAYYQLGDCARALDAWAESELQAAVKSRSDSVTFMQKGYQECEAKGVLPQGRYTPLLSRTRQQLTDVTSLATNVSAAGEANPGVWRAEMKAQYDRAAADLQTARTRLESATRTRLEREFNDASTLAERARGAFKALESELGSAIALHGTVQGLVREIDQALAAADATDKALEKKRGSLTPPLVAARQAALEALGRARAQKDAGVRESSVPTLVDARVIAQDASTKYRDVLDAVTKLEALAHQARVTEALTAAQEAFSFVERGFASLDRLSMERPGAVTAEITVEREALQKQLDTARRRFETSERNRDVAGLQEVAKRATELRTRLESLIGVFGPLSLIDRGVRAALIEGARLFLAGDYDRTLEALDPARLGDGPLQAHAHVLRAAAHYALFVRSGEKDRAAQAHAVAEIERVKQINPDFEPDARAFAPRFIRFFRETQPSTAPASSSQQR
jgi:tetratricopeptide (TPR) repeat protein